MLFRQVLFCHLAVKLLIRIMKKFAPKWILETETFDPSEDMSVELLKVQELTRKISDEKESLKSILSDVINDNFRQETHEALTDLQDNVKSRFEAIDNKNKASHDEIREMMETLVNEISVLKSQVAENDKILKSPELSQLQEESSGCRKLFSEASIQTEESYEAIPQEISDFGFSDEEWTSLKQKLSDSMIESEELWKDTLLRFFKNLENEYECTKNLLMSSWDDMNREIISCGSVLDKVHHMEQTVFGILLFLQQQYVEAQNVREALQFFDHKFKNLYQKSDDRWNKSNLNLHVAFDSMQNAQAVLNVSSLTFKDMTSDVIQKLERLADMVAQFGYATKLLNDAEHLTYSMDRNIGNLIVNVTNLTSKIEGTYCQEIGKLSEKLLVPGEKMYVFFKTLDELLVFADASKVPSNHDFSTMQAADLKSKGKHVFDNNPSDDKSNHVRQMNPRACESFNDLLKQSHEAYSQCNNSQEYKSQEKHVSDDKRGEAKKVFSNVLKKIRRNAFFEDASMKHQTLHGVPNNNPRAEKQQNEVLLDDNSSDSLIENNKDVASGHKFRSG